MTQERILLVEDDTALAQLIEQYLSGKGYEITVLNEGISAVDHIVNEQPDLTILDLMLPGKDGITICREARPSYSGAIMMLTASDDSVDQVVGLEIGADDYVKKPIEPRVLLARIRALLRRQQSDTAKPSASSSTGVSQRTFRDLCIDYATREVTLNGEVLALSTPEFDVLEVLTENAGIVQSRDDLFRQLKNLEYDGQNRFVDITVSQIRKKLGEYSEHYIKTVRGKGYLFLPSS